MATYVVAGATGRVGSVVARELRARSISPKVIIRDEARAALWRGGGGDAVVGSLDDLAFLTRALRGADGLFAILPDNVPPDDFHGVRRRLADAVAGAVRDSGVPHVVMLSALVASLPDGNGPGKDLYYLEHLLRATSARLSLLRSCSFQDNIATLLPPASAGIYPNFFASAAVAMPMIATKDVGRFAAEALMSTPPASEVVDLLGPAYSVRDLAERLGAALGKKLTIMDIPPCRHVATLTQAGVPRSVAEAVAEMLAAVAAGKVVPCGDRQLIGTTTIDEVIAGCLKRDPTAVVRT